MGGEDVRALQLRSLQEQISVVSQDTSLFNDTVAVSCISAGKSHGTLPSSGFGLVLFDLKWSATERLLDHCSTTSVMACRARRRSRSRRLRRRRRCIMR